MTSTLAPSVTSPADREELAQLANEMTDNIIALKPAPPPPPANKPPARQPPARQPPARQPPAAEAPLISLDDNFEIPSAELQRLSNDVNTSRPPVSTRSAPAPPQPKPRPTGPPITLPPDKITRDTVREFLTERQTQFRQAGAAAKLSQQNDKMRQCLKYSLMFNKVIAALDEGNPISLDAMPSAPAGYQPSFLLAISSWPIQQTQAPRKPSSSDSSAPTRSDSPPPESDPSIPVPTTLLEGLQQRLDKYKEGVTKAEQEGNSSKARRMKRVLAQFEEAIAACKSGKPYDYSELPAPPGYPPLPPPGARRLPQAVPTPAPAPRPPVSVPSQPAEAPSPDDDDDGK